ncbi:MarR family winged helix-turn-helix transcriptional regulator [Celerinatantimonas sp. YJH-8]|uniref:MarR family winged helix-turn-helix transcriptional regulator n=1 Tax=Celerinatantimonas sp. YJH-8 TaxID=3228714 RepID=UPI0038C257FE
MSEISESELVIHLIGLHSKMQKRMSRALSVHGLGVSEYLVLHQLYTAPTQTLRRSDLAELVGLSPSGVTRLINPMEKMGLVQKEENLRDARVSLVTLSAAGKQIYEEAQVSFAHVAAALFEPLGATPLGTLAELLLTLTKGS